MAVAAVVVAGGLRAQTVAPPEVVRSALGAVEDLGKQVVMGNHQAAIERMYPQWKERMAKRKGGMAKLEEELSGIGETLARNGITIISFKVTGEPKVYEVFPDGNAEQAGEAMSYSKWLLLIPTATRLRMLPPNERKPRVMDSFGFQVAISEKGENDWTFINGSDVSVSDLRSLFLTLPPDMQLPQGKVQAVE